MGVDDFLLERNFLRTYQVLDDFTAMKVVVRYPSQTVWYYAQAQVSNESFSASVALASVARLPYCEPSLIFRKHHGQRGRDGFALRHFRQLDKRRSNNQRGYPFGNCGSRDFSPQGNPEVASEQQSENKSVAKFVSKVFEEMNIDTSSEYNSSSEFEFLSSTDPS